MRVVYMGTPDFAVGVLKKIVDAGHTVVGVYTQPDKPKGRGKSMQFTPVKQTALDLGLSVFQPAKVKDPEIIEEIRNLKPDVIVVVAFGQILPEEILNIPPKGCINVHASLLPKYRGAAPIQRVIIDGEKVSGVTTMYMAKGLDTGDMIEKVEVPIAEKETGGSYHDKLAVAGAELCASTLEKIEAGTAERIPQDDAQSCYAHMLDKAMGEIDFSRPAIETERLIRGLNPWPSAYTFLDGKMLKIYEADVLSGDFGEAGQIVRVGKHDFSVACGEGALCIKDLQIEGKKRMDATAFLNGMTIEVGRKLGR